MAGGYALDREEVFTNQKQFVDRQGWALRLGQHLQGLQSHDILAISLGAMPMDDLTVRKLGSKDVSILNAETGEGHLDYALSTLAGQGALGVFALLNFNIFVIHLGQVTSDARFVYSPDSTDPYENPERTLRYVRVLDVCVSFGWGLFCAILSGSLFLKQMDVSTVRTRLQTSVLSVTVVYLVGAASDFGQCRYQAGGIGSRCHGVSCLQTAGACASALVVMQLHARFFLAFSFMVESGYRLNWLSKEENLSNAHGMEVSFRQSMVLSWVVLLAVYPIVLHYREIARVAKCNSCYDSEFPPEPVLPKSTPSAPIHVTKPVSISLPEHAADVAAKRGLKDCVTCTMNDDSAALARTKEDDSNLGAGREGTASRERFVHIMYYMYVCV